MLPSQLYDDPENRTWGIVARVLAEVVLLFPDKYFLVGGDETGLYTNGVECAKANTPEWRSGNARQFGEKLQELVRSHGRLPGGDDEMVVGTGAASAGMLVLANNNGNVSESTGISACAAVRRGYPAVELASNNFYLDHPKGPGGSWDPRRSWSNYSTYWTDVAPTCDGGAPQRGSSNMNCLAPADTPEGKSQRALFHGAEVSFWSDHYCDKFECHATIVSPDYPRGCAWFMSGENASASLAGEFVDSVEGMLYPRAAIAAGSFWNYRPGLALTPGAGELWRRLAAHDTRQLRRRSINGCPVYGAVHSAGPAFRRRGAGQVNGSASPCEQGCTEAARCGAAYAHVPSALLPLEKACPYHF